MRMSTELDFWLRLGNDLIWKCYFHVYYITYRCTKSLTDPQIAANLGDMTNLKLLGLPKRV